MTIVKCIFEFHGEAYTDLSLSIGDLVKVTKIVNEDWYEGALNGNVGQFPKSFVEECQDVFDVAIATSTFEAEQDGDLSLKEGELVVITDVIDGNWMKGYAQGGKHGMFPQSFVRSVSVDADAFSDDKLSAPGNDDSTKIVVNVLHDFAAQSSNELNLITGNRVEIIKEVDDFWCEGRTEDGMQGIFPRNFVDLPPFETNQSPAKDEVENDVQHIESTVVEENVNAAIGEKVVPAIEENAIMSIGEAVASFDYLSGVEGDLNFHQGERITLLQKIDDNWFKGTVSDQIGMFPSSYVVVTEFVEADDANHQVLETPKPTEQSQAKQKPPKPQQPKKPQKPKPPNFKNAASSDVTEVTYAAVKKAPSRPKPPTKKADDIPFVFQFNTKSQPTVIIPPAHLKAGQQNILLKEPRDLSSNSSNQLRAPNSVASQRISPSSSLNNLQKDISGVPSQKISPSVSSMQRDISYSGADKRFSSSSKETSAADVSDRLQARNPLPGKRTDPTLSMSNVYTNNDHSISEFQSLAKSNASSSYNNVQQHWNSDSMDTYSDKFQSGAASIKTSFGNAQQQQSNSDNMNSYSDRFQNFGNTMKSEYQSVNKNIPNDNMSTYQKMKCANNNLNTVVTVANAVGIKTTKTQVAKGAVKMGAGAYITGSQASKGSKSSPAMKSVAAKGFGKFGSK